MENGAAQVVERGGVAWRGEPRQEEDDIVLVTLNTKWGWKRRHRLKAIEHCKINFSQNFLLLIPCVAQGLPGRRGKGGREPEREWVG